MSPSSPPLNARTGIARTGRLRIALALASCALALSAGVVHWRSAAAHPVVPTGPVEARDVAPLHQGAELRRITAIMLRR
jgi:hypothetical protein